MLSRNRLTFRWLLAATLGGALTCPGLLLGRAQAAPKEADKPAKPVVKLDLNTAKIEQLQELPGIGEVYSKKIVAGRPFKNVKDLVKLGIPAPTIEKISALVTIAPARKPPKKGMVWVNSDSKVYHKEGSQWYGRTKEGTWMTEKDAIKAGNKAAE
jgi:hypothetical protein